MSKSICFASVISEIQQSDVFMTVKARILETPAANLNGARVTDAFLNEIVENEERYVGLPLYADVKALTSGRYDRLGHLYDARTEEFHSTQIGSFYRFEREDFEGGAYLVGYARIPKRNKKLSKAICDLFASNSLKFSFEISLGEYTVQDDDTILIDQSEYNYLEGTAVVSYPACEDAVALELVAQRAEKDGKEDTGMAEVNEQVAAEATVENAENETAAVYVTESHSETDSVYAYDTSTGTEVRQAVTVETHISTTDEGQLVSTTDGIHIAETGEGTQVSEAAEESVHVAEATENATQVAEADGGDSGNESPSDTSDVADESGDGGEQDSNNDSDSESDDSAEDTHDADETRRNIAELLAIMQELKHEIAELRESQKAAASTHAYAEVNPLMGSMEAKRYSLLEKASPTESYSLLERA